MNPVGTASPPPRPQAPRRVEAAPAGITEENTVCALIEALQSPDRYRLVACGGELFLQAVAKP
jgi:hypothetical protein